ncbi:MAG: hypothetical protein PHV13_00525 [Candidatus ainarchaeum sp.]|nr:hypothetical protein [Candidatus ainarchaeum sp.]
MQILYIYDVKAKDKGSFNRAKRLFYYHLGRLSLKKEAWKTKSVLAVQPKMEKTMDSFFRRFGKAVVVYKSYSESIERL